MRQFSVYLVNEDWWNCDPMHQDPTMRPIDRKTFEALSGSIGGVYNDLLSGTSRIVGYHYQSENICLLHLEQP